MPPRALRSQRIAARDKLTASVRPAAAARRRRVPPGNPHSPLPCNYLSNLMRERSNVSNVSFVAAHYITIHTSIRRGEIYLANRRYVCDDSRFNDW